MLPQQLLTNMSLCKCLFVLPSNYNLELVVVTEANLFFCHLHKLSTCMISDSRMLISQLYVCASAVWTVKSLISLVATPGIQGLKDTEQSPHPSLRPRLSPLSPPTFPSQLQQPLQAGLPPRINYSQSPAAPALASVTQGGVTESRRSEVTLHAATNGTSQKSVDQKPCGDTPTWPLDSVGEQWLVQSL